MSGGATNFVRFVCLKKQYLYPRGKEEEARGEKAGNEDEPKEGEQSGTQRTEISLTKKKVWPSFFFSKKRKPSWAGRKKKENAAGLDSVERAVKLRAKEREGDYLEKMFVQPRKQKKKKKEKDSSRQPGGGGVGDPSLLTEARKKLNIGMIKKGNKNLGRIEKISHGQRMSRKKGAYTGRVHFKGDEPLSEDEFPSCF